MIQQNLIRIKSSFRLDPLRPLRGQTIRRKKRPWTLFVSMDDMVHGRYRNFGLSNFEIRIVHVLSENKRTHKFSALRRGRARSTAVRLLYQCRMARDSSSITRCGPSGSSGRRSVATNSRSLIARRVAGSRTLESPPRDVPPRHSRGRVRAPRPRTTCRQHRSAWSAPTPTTAHGPTTSTGGRYATSSVDSDGDRSRSTTAPSPSFRDSSRYDTRRQHAEFGGRGSPVGSSPRPRARPRRIPSTDQVTKGGVIER